MNEEQLFAELRNSLLTTVVVDEVEPDGRIVRITKFLISDETQRQELTTKYVEMLKSINPATNA